MQRSTAQGRDGREGRGRGPARDLSLLLLLLALAAPVSGDEAKESPREPTPSEEAPARSDSRTSSSGPALLPIYVPPSRDASRSRVGAATRGGAASAPSPLAPDHVALTIQAQPVLYWALLEDSDALIEHRLVADGETVPLLDVGLPGPTAKGIHRLPLAEHGVSLETGSVVRWVVAGIPDPRRPWKDQVDNAAIERVAAPPELLSELEGGASPRYAILAKHGFWVDAIQDLSERIEGSPGEAGLREARAALLSSVKRQRLARLDREAR